MEMKKKNYVFNLEDGSKNFEIRNASGELLWLKNEGIPFLPVCSRAVIWSEPEVKVENESEIVFQMETNSIFENPKVVFELKDDFVEFYFKGKAKRKMSLNRWHLFQPGTDLRALECFDFRSHIDSPMAYKVHQTVLGRRKLGTVGLDANTEDSDLMFAPHPMLFVFENLRDSMVIAPMELVSAESLHIRMVKGSTIIEDFHIEVGKSLYWLEEGEELESPHFMISLSKDKDIYEALTQYTESLVKENRIVEKKREDMQPWWLSPMWCSWGDQHTFLDSAEVIHLATTKEARTQAVHNINDNLIDRVVKVIEENELPIRTLILDDRWYTKQGDMYADTEKFPDMRATVDRLHEKGFKVMAWSSLYQFDRDSEAFKNHPEWFLVHHYHRNWHNPDKDIIHLDYSDKEIAQTYLTDLLERLLSDKEGCYNFDGIKFDWPFLIPHDYPYPNRDWIGKEKTVYNTQKVIYDTAKSIKSDSLIIGVSPHPFFQDTQDIIRTYDVSTFDIRIHLGRSKYIRAMSPGMMPALDEHVYYQNFFEYMGHAGEYGIPMIYNILRFNGDGHVYTPEDYAKLKELLDKYVADCPELKEHLDK